MKRLEAKLLVLCKKDPIIVDLFKICPQMLRGYPWYIGASSIAAAVWNNEHKFTPGTGVKDYDIAYFDPDLSEDKEQRIETLVASLVPGVKIDVKNQARVHLWYPRVFGVKVAPLQSLEEAIGTWPTTVTALGIRTEDVYSPFGLQDLFDLVVRPNKIQIKEPYYVKKTARWKTTWPLLNILPWDN